MAERKLRAIDGGKAEAPEDLVEERVPPHDLQLEANVVANAIYQPDMLADLVIFVAWTDFYSESHGRIFEVAERLHREGRPVDNLVVATELRTACRLEQVGGFKYLTELAAFQVATRRNVLEHARRVRELRVVRDVILTSQRVVAQGYAGAGDVASYVDGAQRAVEALRGELGGIEDEHRADRVAGRMMQSLENAARKVTTGKSRRWGWTCIDERTAGLHAELAVVGARPGMGKTSLGCTVAMSQAAIGYGSPIFSLETPRELLLMRMACARARVEIHRARVGALTAGEWTRFTTAAGELAKLPFWIDDTKGIRVAEIWSRTRRIQLALAREGRELGPVVIDYLQLLGKPQPGMDREEAIDENCRALLALSQELQVPVIALAQLKPEVDKRNDKRPDTGDLRGSGSILMHARTVLLLYRADYYGKKRAGYRPTGDVEINIAKQNNGPTGTVTMRFEETFGVFGEPILQQGPELAPGPTYTCGACGDRTSAGQSCPCGRTTSPAAHASTCRCDDCRSAAIAGAQVDDEPSPLTEGLL